MRARTSHSTIGSFGNRSGRGVSVRNEVSTGMERGGRGCEGVATPGVAGGVKAGDMIEGGGWLRASSASCAGVDVLRAGGWKSKPSLAALERWGEKCGGNSVMTTKNVPNKEKEGQGRVEVAGAWESTSWIGQGKVMCSGVAVTYDISETARRMSLFRNRVGIRAAATQRTQSAPESLSALCRTRSALRDAT